jgi:hypothetical protein
MTRRRGVAAAVSVGAVLAGVSLALLGGASPSDAGHGSEPVIADEPTRAAILEQAERAHRREAVRSARHEDPHGEPGPSAVDLARYERIRRRSEPVARRFIAAFARYELGASEAGVARALRASATRAFAGELLDAPPRVGSAPAPASLRLEGVELVPGAVARGRVETVVLVGRLLRGRRSQPIAIELRRRARGWAVAGLGR